MEVKRNQKGQFIKGSIPWSKDKKGLCMNTGRTHFQKGHIPWSKGKFKFESRKCPICNELFQTKPCFKKMFCSKKCVIEWRAMNNIFPPVETRFKKGHKVLKEWKEISSKNNKGRIAWNKDRNWNEWLSKEQQEKVKSNLRIFGKGENNPFYKGGITPEHIKIRRSKEYKLWEDSVMALDNWTCQKCGKQLCNSKLVGHHILNFSEYPELRFALDNGITFCKECHDLFHRIYGKKNNTKEQIIEFIGNYRRHQEIANS